MLKPEQITILEESIRNNFASLSCIEKAILAYGFLKQIYEVPESMITVKSIPALGSRGQDWQHVWVEVDGMPIDTIKNEYNHVIQQAREEGRIQENHPGLVLLMQVNSL